MDSTRRAIYHVVAGARNLIWSATSRSGIDDRLSELLAAAATPHLLPFQVRSIFTTTLMYLSRITGDRIPSLVDHFAALCKQEYSPTRSFSTCVQTALAYRDIGHPLVQRAVSLMEQYYIDSAFGPRDIAHRLGVRPSTLSVVFKRETDRSPSAYLRELRIEHSRLMLGNFDKSIKEVWASVGYNDASTYAHHFKQRFGLAPSQYRRRILSANLLPATHTPPLPRTSGISPPANAHKRVLVVDDDESMRETTCIILKLAGYQIRSSQNAAEALRAVGEFMPDLVLLDWHMPAEDGLECLRNIRRERHHMAVVLLTADWFVDAHADEIASLNASIQTKLCDPDELITLVNCVLAEPCCQ